MTFLQGRGWKGETKSFILDYEKTFQVRAVSIFQNLRFYFLAHFFCNLLHISNNNVKKNVMVNTLAFHTDDRSSINF